MNYHITILLPYFILYCKVPFKTKQFKFVSFDYNFLLSIDDHQKKEFCFLNP